MVVCLLGQAAWLDSTTGRLDLAIPIRFSMAADDQTSEEPHGCRICMAADLEKPTAVKSCGHSFWCDRST